METYSASGYKIRRFLMPLALTFVLIIGLFAGLIGGVMIDRQVILAKAAPASSQTEQTINLDLISEAWKIITQDYVDRGAVKANQLTYGAITGMVDSLGDTGHSRFMSPEMVRQEHTMTQGEFEGIGAEVQMKDGHVVVVAPIDGSPAQEAGVHPGDIILKVDGVSMDGLSLDEVVSHVLGPAGTQVTITFEDAKTSQTRDLTITRARIQIHSVSWMMLPGTTIAHLKIASFSKGTTNDLQKALVEIQTQKATGIVLDLRDNPGGLLNEAVGVASQFLKDGNVLQEKDAQGNVVAVAVVPGGLATDIPVVVLINQGTASAAEIVSGALQDAGRSILVGETTFGTGTVLNEFPLSDNSALLLATEEWLTPKGRVIWHQGIQPDQVVSQATDVVLLSPEAEGSMTANQLKLSPDKQLLYAIQLFQTQ
jgi:carboxyl-terminal processing protease